MFRDLGSGYNHPMPLKPFSFIFYSDLMKWTKRLKDASQPDGCGMGDQRGHDAGRCGSGCDLEA